MDTNRIENLNTSVLNKKGAYLAMCRVVLFIFAVTLLSDIAGMWIYTLLSDCSLELQSFLVKLMTTFGASVTDARACAKLVLGSEATAQVISMATTLLFLMLPAYLFSKRAGLEQKDCFIIGGRLSWGIIPVFCLCHLLTTFASVFAGTVNEFILPGSQAVYSASTGVFAHTFNIYEFIISVLCAGVFVPLVEEYVFRGVILGYLRRYGTGFGIVASAVIFGIAHTSPVQSVYAFVFGLVAATLTVVTKSMKAGILFHMGNNLITVLLGYAMGEMSAEGFNMISGIYLAVVCAVGMYGLYGFCKSGGYLEKLSEISDGRADVPGIKETVVFPMIMYLVYYVYNVVITVM